MNFRQIAAALAGLLIFLTASAQNASDRFDERRYLEAILPPDLRRYAGIEVPSEENIHILSDKSDKAGEYLEFRPGTWPGQEEQRHSG
jgi:hypothetical protein